MSTARGWWRRAAPWLRPSVGRAVAALAVYATLPLFPATRVLVDAPPRAVRLKLLEVVRLGLDGSFSVDVHASALPFLALPVAYGAGCALAAAGAALREVLTAAAGGTWGVTRARVAVAALGWLTLPRTFLNAIGSAMSLGPEANHVFFWTAGALGWGLFPLRLVSGLVAKAVVNGVTLYAGLVGATGFQRWFGRPEPVVLEVPGLLVALTTVAAFWWAAACIVTSWWRRSRPAGLFRAGPDGAG